MVAGFFTFPELLAGLDPTSERMRCATVNEFRVDLPLGGAVIPVWLTRSGCLFCGNRWRMDLASVI
jgi:hypothetical protein